MPETPIAFKTAHRIRFSDLDPYDHVRAAAYFIDHRMEGLRGYLGWDLKSLATLPFMVWVRRMEVDFLRPAVGDHAVVIPSFVREFRGPDAPIECRTADLSRAELSRCAMIVAGVDRGTKRARAGSTCVPGRERPLDPVPSAPDVRPRADLDRGAVGRDARR